MKQSNSVSFTEGQNLFIEGKDYDKHKLKDFGKYKAVLESFCTENNGNGKIHLSLCGFMVINDRPIIIFPKNFPIKQDDPNRIVDAARLLFRTFVLYRTRRDQSKGWKPREAETGLEDRDKNAITGVNEILYVLEDFKRNGYLNRRHTVISQTKPGRIVWNRTIHKTTPIISRRQPFYASPYMKSNVRHDEETVQKIHRYLVGKFCRTWGWLVGDLKAEEVPAPCTPREAIVILSAELQSCFVQREIDLIRSMIRYFKEKRGDKEEPREEYMLTPEFEQIWENVCGDVLGNVYGKYKDSIPRPVFSGTRKEWIQKPDILCTKNNSLYVLDAKYYSLEMPISTGKADEEDGERQASQDIHFPGLGDMIKQFVYRYTINCAIAKNNAAFDGAKVAANAMLFPGIGSDSELEPYRYHGTVKIPQAEAFGVIQLWSLDVEMMLRAYTDTDSKNRAKIRKEFLERVTKKEEENMSASIYTISHAYMGKVENDGTVFRGMTDYLGIVDKDHQVYDASRNYLGYADRNGSIYDSNHGYMGKIENEWLYDTSNQMVGRVEGSPRRMAAAAYFLLLR